MMMRSQEAGGNAGLSLSVEEGLVECFRSFTALPGGTAEEREDVLMVRSAVPITFFNGVPWTRFGEDAPARVEETLRSFRAHGAAFRWWLLPSTEPRNLIEILAANRMRHVYYATGMVAALGAPPPPAVPGLSIVRVADAQTLATWVDVFAQGFALSDVAKAAFANAYAAFGTAEDAKWHQFLGILDGVPVATSSLCLGPTIGGIYHVVTLPEARGRGVGAAITAAPMRAAADAGRKIAALQASEMAVSVYRSLGFLACGDLELYDWRPEYET